MREVALYGCFTVIANHDDCLGIRDNGAYQRAPWGVDEANPPAEVGFRSELTHEVEQHVIPGCKRNWSRTLRQPDLFG